MSGILGKIGKALGSGGAGPLMQLSMGVAQLGAGLIGQSKGRKEVESLMKNRPMAEEDTGIMSYYNQALQRAGVSPTASSMYKRQMQNIGRGAATGLRAAQDRRSGLASASNVLREMTNAALGAETAAEGLKRQDIGALGAATQAAAAERRRVFDINKIQPWQTKLGMAAERAAGGAKTANIGLSNIFGAGKSIAAMDIYNKTGKTPSEFYGTGG